MCHSLPGNRPRCFTTRGTGCPNGGKGCFGQLSPRLRKLRFEVTNYDIDDVDDLVHVFAVSDQGRRDIDACTGPAEQAALLEAVTNLRLHVVGLAERLLRRTVFDEVYLHHEAET